MKVERRSWDEFRNIKLLWWINHSLHFLGWTIIVEVDESGAVTEVYPARVRYRGFDEKTNAEGYAGLTSYMNENSEKLLEEVLNNG